MFGGSETDWHGSVAGRKQRVILLKHPSLISTRQDNLHPITIRHVGKLRAADGAAQAGLLKKPLNGGLGGGGSVVGADIQT